MHALSEILFLSVRARFVPFSCMRLIKQGKKMALGNWINLWLCSALSCEIVKFSLYWKAIWEACICQSLEDRWNITYVNSFCHYDKKEDYSVIVLTAKESWEEHNLTATVLTQQKWAITPHTETQALDILLATIRQFFSKRRFRSTQTTS